MEEFEEDGESEMDGDLRLYDREREETTTQRRIRKIIEVSIKIFRIVRRAMPRLLAP